MSEIRSMLEETVGKLLKDYCTKELITEAEKGVFPRDLWATLTELGITSVGIEENQGGAGGDLGDFLSLIKLAGFFATPVPLAEHVLSNWLLSSAGLPVSNKISTFSQEIHKDPITFNLSEEGWILTGRASFVPWGRDADNVIVVGTTSDETMLLASVPLMDCEIKQKNSLAGEPRDEVTLSSVLLPKDKTVMVELELIEKLTLISTLTRVMLMTGAIERILELTVAYSKERIQFGRPISKFQAIQQQLAVLAGEATASMAVADYMINNVDTKLQVDEVAMAKIQLGDAAEVVSRIAHQVHAAMGFTDEHPLHQSTRRVWAWRDEFGNETTWALTLGEKILETSSNRLWPYITSLKG
ncbi:acyl-CoA dehydrogenase [Bacillus mesophilus]|uniref:Acyl-CoA/acyl-ACP dehydrogenase n=1 Tax=Bacillus mesophilus TaxID=1808955 RepID=A0A6M0QBG2_9BACI|nr:acyl-CoA dehydrogenase family protein [Bacillus mesophilus]MBM7663006.1 acyl-CoA dehydrogenase [Bacillus mesophilus]NEY73672.1 acyl-CoA/acyl-ACP dehydrogenase [Bacillus mesophilus]